MRLEPIPDIVDGFGQTAANDGSLRREPGTSVAQAAVATLHEMIDKGRLKVGAPLPPQRELARDLKVSRASLREALSILATTGVISIEPGRGTFVCDPPPESLSLATKVSWRFAARYSPAEVYQFRYIAESHAAQLAAMHHTDTEILDIKSNLEAFRRAARDLDLASYAKSDFEFHKLIMGFSRNRLLADMHRTFASVLLESQRLPLVRRDRLWEAVIEHERIVEALAMNDPQGAGYYMRQHLSRAGNRANIKITELI